MAEAPPCIHRGHILAGVRCFCRHARVRRVVPLGQCGVCDLAEAEGEPSPPVTAPAPPPPTPAELPCAHRSAEPLRTEPCRSCSNHYGLTQIAVYGCARHDECTLPQSEVFRAGNPRRLTKWCQTCRDRAPGSDGA